MFSKMAKVTKKEPKEVPVAERKRGRPKKDDAYVRTEEVYLGESDSSSNQPKSKKMIVLEDSAEEDEEAPKRVAKPVKQKTDAKPVKARGGQMMMVESGEEEEEAEKPVAKTAGILKEKEKPSKKAVNVEVDEEDCFSPQQTEEIEGRIVLVKEEKKKGSKSKETEKEEAKDDIADAFNAMAQSPSKINGPKPVVVSALKALGVGKVALVVAFVSTVGRETSIRDGKSVMQTVTITDNTEDADVVFFGAENCAIAKLLEEDKGYRFYGLKLKEDGQLQFVQGSKVRGKNGERLEE